MPASKAQQKAVNKYMQEHYDRINVTMPKGKKEAIKAHAAARGESANAFINRAVNEAVSRDNGAPEAAGTPAKISGSILTPETEQAARAAAEAAGEQPAEFLSRAVTTQAERDKMLRRMGQKKKD